MRHGLVMLSIAELIEYRLRHTEIAEAVMSRQESKSPGRLQGTSTR
jgi:hypothetical protein